MGGGVDGKPPAWTRRSTAVNRESFLAAAERGFRWGAGEILEGEGGRGGCSARRKETGEQKMEGKEEEERARGTGESFQGKGGGWGNPPRASNLAPLCCDSSCSLILPRLSTFT